MGADVLILAAFFVLGLDAGDFFFVRYQMELGFKKFGRRRFGFGIGGRHDGLQTRIKRVQNTILFFDRFFIGKEFTRFRLAPPDVLRNEHQVIVKRLQRV